MHRRTLRRWLAALLAGISPLAAACADRTEFGDDEVPLCDAVTVEAPDARPDVVFVLDSSFSMRGVAWDALLEVLEWMISEFDDRVRIGARFFPGPDDDTCEVALELPIGTENGDGLLDAALARSPSGSTVVYPALKAATNALADAPGGARALVLLTDGLVFDTCAPSGSIETDVRDLLADAQKRQGIETHVIGLGDDADRVTLADWADAGSGGTRSTYLTTEDFDGLRFAFERVMDEVVVSCDLDLDGVVDPPDLGDEALQSLVVDVGGTAYTGPISDGETCPFDTAGFVITPGPHGDELRLCGAACHRFRSVRRATVGRSCDDTLTSGGS